MIETIPIPDSFNEKQRDLLADVYLLMEYFLSGKGNLKINRYIRKMVYELKNRFNLSKNDILHNIYMTFILKEHYLKYDPDKSRRTTFTAHYTLYGLKSLFKKLMRKKMRPHFSTISLDADCLDYGCPYKGAGYLPGLSNPVTPEDECIKKELQDMLDDFFDELDLQVIFGELDRQDAAKERNVSYDTYRKSLQRKFNELKSVLSETGYLN